MLSLLSCAVLTTAIPITIPLVNTLVMMSLTLSVEAEVSVNLSTRTSCLCLARAVVSHGIHSFIATYTFCCYHCIKSCDYYSQCRNVMQFDLCHVCIQCCVLKHQLGYKCHVVF